MKKRTVLDYKFQPVALEVVPEYAGLPETLDINPLDGTTDVMLEREEARALAAILQRYADTGRIAPREVKQSNPFDALKEGLDRIVGMANHVPPFPTPGIQTVPSPRHWIFAGHGPCPQCQEHNEETAPALPEYKVGDKVINSQNDLCEVQAIYTDGENTRYQIGGRLLTSGEMMSEGFRRVTLVYSEE